MKVDKNIDPKDIYIKVWKSLDFRLSLLKTSRLKGKQHRGNVIFQISNSLLEQELNIVKFV